MRDTARRLPSVLRGRWPPRSQPRPHLDLALPSSKTVRKSISIFKANRLWHFVRGIQAHKYISCSNLHPPRKTGHATLTCHVVGLISRAPFRFRSFHFSSHLHANTKVVLFVPLGSRWNLLEFLPQAPTQNSCLFLADSSGAWRCLPDHAEHLQSPDGISTENLSTGEVPGESCTIEEGGPVFSVDPPLLSCKV